MVYLYLDNGTIRASVDADAKPQGASSYPSLSEALSVELIKAKQREKPKGKAIAQLIAMGAEQHTPSSFCKMMGLRGLNELHIISGVPVSTLNDWFEKKFDAFYTMAVGARTIKQTLEVST